MSEQKLDSRFKRIMIVDDESAITDTFVEYFEARGFAAIGFTSASAALAAVEKFSPDVILLDIMMPEMNGYEFCSRLKARPDLPKIPVVFVSAKQRCEDELRAAHVGGEVFVSKPVPLNELEGIARLMIERSSSA